MHTMNREKILAIHVTVKGFVSRICEELLVCTQLEKANNVMKDGPKTRTAEET